MYHLAKYSKPPWWRGVLKGSLLAVTAIAVITTFMALLCKVTLPKRVQAELSQSIKESCKSCRISMGKAHVSWLPPTIVFTQVELRAGSETETLFVLNLPEVRARIQPWSLLSLLVKVTGLELVRPEFYVLEGDRQASDLFVTNKQGEIPWNLEIEGTRWQEGTFTYERAYPRGRAKLCLTQVSGQLEGIGTTQKFEDQPIRGEVAARLEDSGVVHLSIEALPAQPELYLKGGLLIKRQSLEKLNRFLMMTDGIELQGLLESAEASFSIRDRVFHGDVRARYEGLSIRLGQTADRSPTSAFFQNVLSRIKIDPANTSKGWGHQSRAQDAHRQREEPLIGFILRGLKEAALQVAQD